MNKTPEKKIYFHVGTGKTGTTFLQYHIFPHFKDIYYIQRTRFPRAKKIINGSDHSSYLLSREFDQQLETRVAEFAAMFPDTIPIIVFRRQDQYIASQYRRFVKNGFTAGFKKFLDLENDQGLFQKKHLEYNRQIQILKDHFWQEPIVLIYGDLRADALSFIDKLAQRIGATFKPEDLNLNPKHRSYSEQQLKGIIWLGQYIDMTKRRIFKNEVLHFLWRLFLGGIRYSTLFIARLLPASLFDPQPLLSKTELEEVRLYFQEDWEACVTYSKSHA